MRKNVSNKRITIKSVVVKIKDQSLQDYEGNIHDHVLEIFNSLPDQEKIVFIEDVINMFSIAETRYQYSKSSISYNDGKEDKILINRKEDYGIENKKTLELENGLALIKLKDWAIKVTLISSLGFLALTLICIMVLQQGMNLPPYLSYIKELYNIVNPK